LLFRQARLGYVVLQHRSPGQTPARVGAAPLPVKSGAILALEALRAEVLSGVVGLEDGLEVDLLLLTPMGLFLVEVKSRPGRVRGDPGTWTWETDGQLVTAANPLLAANFKAKKLRHLLERQKAVRVKGSLPWVDALVFLSAPGIQCDLRDRGAVRGPGRGAGVGDPRTVVDGPCRQ
jgi:hypothetical protein